MGDAKKRVDGMMRFGVSFSEACDYLTRQFVYTGLLDIPFAWYRGWGFVGNFPVPLGFVRLLFSW